MADVLKREFDLLALRISMDFDGESPAVRVALQGSEKGQRGIIAEWSIDAETIGIPERLERSSRHYEGYPFSFPADILGQIGQAIAASGYQGRPLWLHLAKPLGYLNLVPWEQLLQPALDLPILRLPDFLANPPRESLDRFEVALCGSMPAAKSQFTAADHLIRITGLLLETVSRRTTVHIFSDAELYDELKHRVQDNGFANVQVHNPALAAAFGSADRQYGLSQTPGRVQNPWLLWMRDALSGRGVDMVQFLAHGYLSRDSGALALAESPVQNLDRRIARFVDAPELLAFLTQTGAWCAAFSSPEQNYSEMGLRLLADTVAQLRPGPVLHHEIRLDYNGAALADAYRFLFGQGEHPPPKSLGLLMYCHPSLFEPRPAATRSIGFQVLAAAPALSAEDAISAAYADAEFVPSWVGSSQRYIEQRRRDVERMRRAEDSGDPDSGRERDAQAQIISDTLEEIEVELVNVLPNKRMSGR